jgi:hypothetical protein
MKNIWLLMSLFLILVPALRLGAASELTSPTKHAEYLKDETYKFNYEAFTEVINRIKGYYSEDEYAAFVQDLDGRIAEILKSAESDRKDPGTWSQEEELAAWSYVWGGLTDELNLTVIPVEKLKRDAKGVQGYWELKDETREGYMLVENTGDDALYSNYVAIRIGAKGALGKIGPSEGTDGSAEGYFSGYGNLKDGLLSAEYEYETSFEAPSPDVITIQIEFNGEAASVSTSEAFKKGELGKNVIYDGAYVRVRND